MIGVIGGEFTVANNSVSYQFIDLQILVEGKGSLSLGQDRVRGDSKRGGNSGKGNSGKDITEVGKTGSHGYAELIT